MTEEDLIQFKRSGGVVHIGRPAMDLLDELVRLAKLNGYPKALKTDSNEIRKICNFSNQSYWNARDQLIKAGIVLNYEWEGTYFLNYNYTKNI